MRRSRPTHRPTRYGFTMIEITLALAILVFGLLAAYEQFIATSKRGRERLKPVQARFLAHQELEQLRACSFETLKSWTPPAKSMPYPADVNGFYFYQDQINPRPDGLLDLTVSIGWDMRGGEPFAPAYSVTVKGVKAP